MLRTFSKTDVCKPLCLCKQKDVNFWAPCVSSRYKSHYQTLGVDPSASPDEIKTAYYKLSFMFHPDKNEGSGASTAKFREITEAYEVLGNAEKKNKYDQQILARSQQRQSTSGESSQTIFNSSTMRRKHPHVYTGKTSYYDFDAHYREHYERYYEMKRMRREYMYNDMRTRRTMRSFSLGHLILMYVVLCCGFGIFSMNIEQPKQPKIVYYNSSQSSPKKKDDAKKDPNPTQS